MTISNYEIRYQFKIILLGNGGVGKTCLANRFCYDSFNLNTRLSIGISFNTYSLDVIDKGEKVGLGVAIWDFGGQERFRALIPQFISGAHAAILVYDPTFKQSLYDLYSQWISILDGNTGEIPRILVETKYDLIGEGSLISDSEINKYMKKLECDKFLRTSSKTGYQVDDVFIQTTELILKRFYKGVRIINGSKK